MWMQNTIQVVKAQSVEKSASRPVDLRGMRVIRVKAKQYALRSRLSKLRVEVSAIRKLAFLSADFGIRIAE